MLKRYRLTIQVSMTAVLVFIISSVSMADDHWDTLAELHAVESRLLEAGVVCIAFEIVSEGAVESDLKGTARMTRPTSARIEAQGEFAGASVDILFRTHIDRMYGQNGSKRFEEETPAALTEGLIIGMTRMGLLHNLAMLSSGSPPDKTDGTVKKWVKPGNIRKGPAKQIGESRAEALEFTVVVDGQPSGEATLWLDSETGLPVKRKQVVHFSQGDMSVTESYASVSFDCDPGSL
ncbi:MAG: hypothetical protein ACR2QU_07895 [Gammaproteobacteria bacterium]